MPSVGLRSMIAAFSGHTHLPFHYVFVVRFYRQKTSITGNRMRLRNVYLPLMIVLSLQTVPMMMNAVCGNSTGSTLFAKVHVYRYPE